MSRDTGVATATIDLDQPRLVHSFSISGEYPFSDEMRLDRRPDTYGMLVAAKDEWAAPVALAAAVG